MKVVETIRKTKVLSRSRFGCLRQVYTVNVARGCHFGCVYCYARGYPGAPGPDCVELYSNVPEMLKAELDNPRRRSRVEQVAFNTATDSFQKHPDVLDVTYRSMEILADRKIRFSFLTKGWIPDRFIKLFSRCSGRVKARIGLVSLSPSYISTFEPNAATAEERLGNIERLMSAGVPVEVRSDPIIPFVTDSDDSISKLFGAIAGRGVDTVSISYLHLRPAIMEQLKELPRKEYQLLTSCFRGREWSRVGESTRTKLIPAPLREKNYERITRIADGFGLRTYVCTCKNPDINDSMQCHDSTGTKDYDGRPQAIDGQMRLFGP